MRNQIPKLTFLMIIIGLMLTACDEKSENSFSYEEFKKALYFNGSTGGYSDLGSLDMCINRWGIPEYVKSMGTMNKDGGNSRLNTIVFRWSNIVVDGKNVKIYFEAIPKSGKTIEDVFTNSISLSMAKYLKVKEFRLTPLKKPK